MSDIYRQHRPDDEVEPYYSRHVNRLTVEKLHSKREIARELAVRDRIIDRLKARVGELEDAEFWEEPKPLHVPGSEAITAEQVLTWMTGRPGCSWVASIRDIERALKAITEMSGFAPETDDGK